MKTPALAGLAGAVLLTAACAVAPPYTKPEPPAMPAAFKELGEWKAAKPLDEVPRGAWWEVFGEAELTALEARVAVSNQTLKAAQAQFDQARALARSARAGQFPQVTAGASTSGIEVSANKPLRSPTSDRQYNDYIVRGDVSYELDVWGRVASTVSAAQASAQASAGDVEAVRLSVCAELAQDYFLVRGLDAEKQILDSSVAALERALELTRNRFKGGVASGVDVAQAETQLQATKVQAIDITVRRAQLEHAMAALLGVPASSFSLAPQPLKAVAPVIPSGLPADILERRPDVAAAERRVAAANAQVGVAASAFYPLLTLTGNTGFESANLGSWLKLASNFWAVAPVAAMTVFDGGRRRAASDAAVAAYERAQAQYRDTILTAFREVEDNLAALRILAAEAKTQDAAVAAAERLLTLANNRYKGGVATYLEVVVAQNAALANQRNAVTILSRRLTASVLLIKAFGGGWHTGVSPTK